MYSSGRLLAVLSLLSLPFGVATAQQTTTPEPSAPAGQQQLPPLSPEAQQAMIAYTQGLAALRSGKPEQAIDKLKLAIRLKPEEAQFHYMLAQAYGDTGDYPLRWYALRQAVRLDPEHEEAVRSFEQMWDVAVEKGVLDVGEGRDEVKAALGEPDQAAPDGSTWVYGYRAVQFRDDRVNALIDLRGQGGLQPAEEVFALDLDAQNWHLKERHISRAESTLVYAPADAEQSADQRFTLQRLVDMKSRRSPHQIMQDMREHLTTQFPQVDWQVLQDDGDDVMFEWSLGGEDLPSQHEIVRLAAGADDVYRLTYSNKQADLAPALREDWVNRLRKAQLKPLE